MEKIVNFLVENYLWIMAVLIVSIITIIGFLADVRNKSKKSKMEVQKPVVPTETPVNPVVEPSLEPTPAKVNLASSGINVSNTTSTPVGQTLDFNNQNIPVSPVQNIPVQNRVIEPAVQNISVQGQVPESPVIPTPVPQTPFVQPQPAVEPQPVQPQSAPLTQVYPSQSQAPMMGNAVVQPSSATPQTTISNGEPSANATENDFWKL